MKKLFLLSVMCLMALTMQAQRCAVLDFNVGENLSEEDVDGISYIFASNFNPVGYQMLERPYINRIIREKGYRRTVMTQRQLLAIGRALTASIIVVGDVNLFMDEYNVDVRVLNVETGGTITSEDVSFKRSEYREHIKALAKKLAGKVRGGQSQGGYGQGASPAGNSSNRVVPQGYVDLGLPSGTLWKATNESGFYDYDTAVGRYGDKLPTVEQWTELTEYCSWSREGTKLKIVGANGNFIILSAMGTRFCNGSVDGVGSWGGYWSSMPSGTQEACSFGYDQVRDPYIINFSRCSGKSVRLVQNP